MGRARVNPYGRPAGDVEVVQVGEKGKFTHIYNPRRKAHLCRSGIKHGNVPELYPSMAQFVTCYRCQKLADVNVRSGRSPDDDGGKR
jgi:hypothetical protein